MTNLGKESASGLVHLLLWLGGLAVVGGVLLGVVPSGQCGSPWFPDSQAAEVNSLSSAMAGLPDTFQADCDAQFGSRGAFGGGLVGLGVLFGLAAAVVWSQGRRPGVVVLEKSAPESGQ